MEQIKQLFSDYWLSITLTGSLIAIIGVFLFIYFIRRWGDGDPSKSIDQTFILLLKQITVSIFAFSIGMALLLGGLEAGSTGKGLSTIALDGQTLSGLITLIIAVPAALASALVIISLGKNQNELVKRDIEAHDDRESKEIRESIHLAEEKFSRINEAYDRVLHSISALSRRIDRNTSILFEDHSNWTFSGNGDIIEPIDYVKSVFNLDQKIDAELRAEYPLDLDTLRGSTHSKIMKSLKNEEREKQYEHIISRLTEIRSDQRSASILNSPPKFRSDTEKNRDCLNDLRKDENRLLEAMRRMIDALRNASIDSACTSVWNDRVNELKNRADSFLSKIKPFGCGHADLDARIFWDAATTPSLHRLAKRFEDTLVQLEDLLERKERRLEREIDGFLAEYYPSLVTVLRVLEYEKYEGSLPPFDPYDALDYWKFPIYSLRESTTLNMNLDSVSLGEGQRVSINRLGLLLFVVGLCLPERPDVIRGLKSRGIFDEMSFEKTRLFESILPDENEYFARSQDANLSEHLILSSDVLEEPVKELGEMEEIEHLESKLVAILGRHPVMSA